MNRFGCSTAMKRVMCLTMPLLPVEQRMVISLKLHGGLSFRAIARDIGMPLGTVQSRYRYGLDRLRRELDKR